MSNLRDFSENELKVFKCFITPKYPSAIRSVSAVAKETKLEEDDILDIFKAYDQILFTHIETNKWCFNIALFAKKFALKYPHLFEKYEVTQSPVGVVVIPKGISPDVIKKIMASVAEDDGNPGVSEIMSTLDRMLNDALKKAEEPSDVISFSA